MTDPKLIKSIIRATIISNPLKTTVKQLQNDFKNYEGYDVPYRQLGFSDFTQYLHSIPDTVLVVGCGPNAEVSVVLDEKSAHVAELVSKQRTTTKKQRPSTRFYRPPRLERARYFFNPISQNKENQPLSPKSNNSTPQHSNANNLARKCPQNNLKVERPENDDKAEILLQEPVDQVEHVNYKIPRLMQENLILLIKDFPDGLWCSKLPTEYRLRFGGNFSYTEYGYKSLIQLCCELPGIFKFVRPSKGDYKLFHVGATAVNLLEASQSITGVREEEQEVKPAVPDNLSEIFKSSLALSPPHIVGLDAVIPQQEIVSKVGDYIDVQIAEVYDPSKFWFSLHKHIEKLDNLMDEMQLFYRDNSKMYEIPSCVLQEGLYCASIYMREYHRAIVTNMMPHSKTSVKVFFLDYGTVSTVSMDGLFYLHNDFAELPAQAIRGRLAKIHPPQQNEMWSVESSHYFLDLIRNKVFVAEIHAKDEKTETFDLIVADTSSEKDVFVNDSLVAAGFARFDHQVTDSLPLDYKNKRLSHKDILKRMNNMGWKDVYSYGKYFPCVDNIHLVPTFDEIEKALVPNLSEMLVILSANVSLDKVFPQYFLSVLDNLEVTQQKYTYFTSDKGKLTPHHTKMNISSTVINKPHQNNSFFYNQTTSPLDFIHMSESPLHGPKSPNPEFSLLHSNFTFQPQPIWNIPFPANQINTSTFQYTPVKKQTFEEPVAELKTIAARRSNSVIKTQIFGLNLHVILFKEEPHVLINEVHKHYPATSLLLLKRALSIEKSINIIDVNLNKNTHLLNELLNCNAIDGVIDIVDLIPLRYLVDVMKHLGSEGVVLESFESVLRLYNRDSQIWNEF